MDPGPLDHALNNLGRGDFRNAPARIALALWIAITVGPIVALQTNGNKERSSDGAADHAADPIDVDTRQAEE